MKKTYYLFLLVLTCLMACETNFDVNAPWKESAIIYGLLDQTVDTQKVIIYKAFLGQESAYIMAQDADSFYYDKDDLEVIIYGVDNNGDTIEEIELEYQITNNRFNSGFDTIFSTEYSVEYITTKSLDQSLTYHLYVRNVVSDYIARSKTNLIEPLNINPGFTDEITFFKNNEYRSHRLRWTSSAFGKIYKPFMRFYYYEKNILTNDVVQKYKDLSFSQMYSQSTSGNQNMEIVITGENFFYFVKNSIEENLNVLRIIAKDLEDGFTEYDYWVGGIDFYFLVGGEAISQYIQINNLPSLIFEDPPNYTNIENGIGVFSSRLHAESIGKFLDIQTLTELSNGELTSELNFIEP